ncbi:putative axoneme central apparatus protein [Trypanosoma theileri]|uniref:Putative axoneme central apparatus protein n=1 Tax=Trypanosoma theileri TaxID=67003 RepID=A0A1X0NLT4_9TRYP|nr:putative axoneme central apparatus protein [Trypanosoma theileri]ORC85676.1 putative axoneme central apparatus protein [Trypanosoma theileri]
MRAVNQKAGVNNLGKANARARSLPSPVVAGRGRAGHNINHPFINRNGLRNDNFSDDDDDDLSLSSDNMTALPTSVVNCTANRYIGLVSQSEYETTDDEEEGSYSDSSLERSGEYKPLGFTIILGNQPRTPYKRKVSSINVNLSVESQNVMSISDVPLPAKCNIRRPSVSGVHKGYNYEFEVSQSESEVEIAEPQEDALNAIIINKLVKRLRDPSIKVSSREFEELNWDDPNFEKELSALKEVASYIEVKETMLKVGKEGIIKAADRIDQKIKEILMTLPEVVVVKKKDKIIEGSGILRTQEKTVNKSELPMNPEKAHVNVEREKNLQTANMNGVKGDSKESHMQARPSKKKKMTDSMLLKADATAITKESTMTSAKVSKKKNRESLLISQDIPCPVKEATFSENEKPSRRKRSEKNTSKISLVMDTLPEETGDEIVETEYMIPEETQKKNESPGVLRAKSMRDGNKETVNNDKEIATKDTESSSKKKRRSQKNRSVSLLVECVPEEPAGDLIHEKDISLRNKNATSEQNARSKKNDASLKKRRSRKHINNRSITFTEVIDDESAHDIVETVAERLTEKEYVPAPPSASKTNKNDRRRRERNNASRSNLSFAELPEVIDQTVEDDCADGISKSTTRGSGRHALEEKRKPHNKKNTVVPSDSNKKSETTTSEKSKRKPGDEKKRHRRTNDCPRSRELEYSFIPDEVSSEIKDADGDAEYLKPKKESLSRLSEHHLLSRKDTQQSNDLNVPNGGLPQLVPISATSSSRTKSGRGYHNMVNMAKLPDLAGSEIPDNIVEPLNSKKAPPKRSAPVDVVNKSKKSRSIKSNHPSRSQTSFMALPDENIIELKENVGDMINGTGRENSVNKPISSHRSGRPRNSAASSMVSVGIIPPVELADNVEFPS